jgi:hypothetical protein
MKRLKIDIEEVAMAMENHYRDYLDYYLDTQNGGVVGISEDLLRKVESGKSLDDLPDWEREDVKCAEGILSNSGHYQRIPEKPAFESYDLMVKFIETIPNLSLKENLSKTIQGKGAFSRFKDMLLPYPDIEQQNSGISSNRND